MKYVTLVISHSEGKADNVQVFKYTKDFFEDIKKVIEFQNGFKGYWLDRITEYRYAIGETEYVLLRKKSVDELDDGYMKLAIHKYSDMHNGIK